MNMQGILAGGSLSSLCPNTWSHLQPPPSRSPALAWALPGEVAALPSVPEAPGNRTVLMAGHCRSYSSGLRTSLGSVPSSVQE